MNISDWTGILTPAILDLTSMISANVPGWGTVASAGTGIASTLWTGIRDWENAGMKSGLKTLGMGLSADALGLIPGWGTSAKLGKIAKGLSKYAKYIGPALAAKGLGDAAGVFNKLMTQGGSSLTKDDLNTLVYGLVGLTSKGTAGVKRANRSNLERAAAQQYNVTTKSGKEVTLNVEQLAKLRAQHKVRKATPVVTSDALIEANDQIMNASKWPVFGSVSQNRLEKMLDLRQASKKNIWLNTIYKPVGKGKREEIPAYKPAGLNSQDWSLNIQLPTISKKKSIEKFQNFKKNYYKKKEKNKASSEKYGGVLKALRKGGIIKADDGVKLPSLKGYATDADWANLNFGTADNHSYADNGFSNRESGGIGWSRGLYNNGTEGEFYQDLNSARQAQYNYYTFNKGKNIFGDVLNYYNEWKQSTPNGTYQDFIKQYNSNVDALRSRNKQKLDTKFNDSGWGDFNDLFHKMYKSYGLTSTIENGKEVIKDDWSDKLKNYFGESTARRVPNTFDDHEQFADLRNGLLNDKDLKSRVGIDNEGKLFMYDQDDGVKETAPEDEQDVVDEETGKGSTFETKFKNPNDPTPWFIAGKTALGLMGNRNIYKNLLDEMPQAPLRDPVNRQLAIVGWQEQIKQGQNQLADLRNATWMQHGSDQQTNLAGMHEVENKGRGIMDDKYMKDSGRQFDTAQKLWNLKNEDVLYNLGVGDANRKSIADRARMMAQIRAAWRSGDNNILMGALSDTGNWMMKKYQREQDLVDKVKELSLGNLESYADFALRENPVYKELLAKKQAGTLTEADRAKMLEIKLSMQDKLVKDYANDYYKLYHTPLFGGGVSESLLKDGGKLEVAKLKARGKDNDRYVSMIKDLRKSSYRRRRR